MDVKRLDANAKLKMYETSKKEKDVLKTDADQNKNASSKTDSPDKINISREAKNLNILDFVISKIKSETDKADNAEKINALKEQIKSGEYAVSPGDIAAAVISAKG